MPERATACRGPGQRVLPMHAPRLAKLKSPNTQPVMRTAAGAHHWRLQLLEFLPTDGGAGDIVTLGDGGTGAARARRRCRTISAIDRCYVHGDAAARAEARHRPQQRLDDDLEFLHLATSRPIGQDTQAIAGWNGPGPYTIENNYLEGAGENFILGGSDPAIHRARDRGRGVPPQPPREAGCRGDRRRWQVKNLFELKNARRVLVEGNLMEYVWQEAQVGYAILLTPRNQDGKAPWVTVEDVTIRRNVVRHAGGALQIIGEDSNFPSGSTRRVKIVDNLFYDVDAATWGGHRRVRC